MADKTSKSGKSEKQNARKSRASNVDPLIVAGGAALVGAAVGALIPRSDAEKRALAPFGALASTAATRALHSARAAVSTEVAALPVVGPIAAAQIDHAVQAVIGPDDGSTAG